MPIKQKLNSSGVSVFFLSISLHVTYRLLGGKSYLGVFVAFSISGLSLYLFEVTSTWSVYLNFIFLFVAGAANCGPDLVVSGSLATEVAKAANAESAVAGLVNGKTIYYLF